MSYIRYFSTKEKPSKRLMTMRSRKIHKETGLKGKELCKKVAEDLQAEGYDVSAEDVREHAVDNGLLAFVAGTGVIAGAHAINAHRSKKNADKLLKEAEDYDKRITANRSKSRESWDKYNKATDKLEKSQYGIEGLKSDFEIESDRFKRNKALNEADDYKDKHRFEKNYAIGAGAMAGTALAAYGGYKLYKHLKKKKKEKESKTVY